MPNQLTRQRRKKRLLDQTSKLEEEEKAPTEPLQMEVNKQNAKITATEGEDRKIKKEAQIAAEDAEDAEEKALARITAEVQGEQRVPTKHCQQHRHNNSEPRNGPGDDYVEPVRENHKSPYAVREQDKSIYAVEHKDAEDKIQRTVGIEGKIREMNVGTESETDALKKSIKDVERVISNTASLIGTKRARLHETKSDKKKTEASLSK